MKLSLLKNSLVKKLLSRQFIQFIIVGVVLIAVGLCIYTPDSDLLRKSADFTVHIMLTCLFLGMFFLVFDQKKLMYTSLGASFLLCLFLKEASNPNLLFPNKNLEPAISIAYINVKNADDDLKKFLGRVKDLDADVISFSEVDPAWNQLLRYHLSEDYKYSESLVRIDPQGMCVFSKLPISDIDTVYYENNPNLLSTFNINGRPISVMSSYLVPALDKATGNTAGAQLSAVADALNELEHPFFSIGGYNQTYWSSQITNFRKEANLENSRRDISSVGLNVKVLYDHIFYSPHLECIDFTDIYSENMSYLGIMGSFQFKLDEVSESKSSYTSRILRF